MINWIFSGLLSIGISSPEPISNGYGWPDLQSTGDTDGPRDQLKHSLQNPRKCSLSPLNPCPDIRLCIV